MEFFALGRFRFYPSNHPLLQRRSSYQICSQCRQYGCTWWAPNSLIRNRHHASWASRDSTHRPIRARLRTMISDRWMLNPFVTYHGTDFRSPLFFCTIFSEHMNILRVAQQLGCNQRTNCVLAARQLWLIKCRSKCEHRMSAWWLLAGKSGFHPTQRILRPVVPYLHASFECVRSELNDIRSTVADICFSVEGSMKDSGGSVQIDVNAFGGLPAEYQQCWRLKLSTLYSKPRSFWAELSANDWEKFN